VEIRDVILADVKEQRVLAGDALVEEFARKEFEDVGEYIVRDGAEQWYDI
jgi:hypothetical protein